MITAILVGDREVVARLSAMPGNLRQGLARTITKLELQLVALVKRKLSGEVLQIRSGRLRNSITGRVQQSATSVIATVSTDVPYAKFQEEGVPHSWEIRPRSARALAFDVAGAQRRGGSHILSETIFAMRVVHPPLPARSFMASSLHEMEPLIRAELEAAVSGELHAA